MKWGGRENVALAAGLLIYSMKKKQTQLTFNCNLFYRNLWLFVSDITSKD